MKKAPPMDDTPLQCPRCVVKMRKQRHAKAVIDHCDECHGNFFDEGEMLKVLGKSADPEVWARSNRKRTPSASELTCPRCHKRMHLHPLAEAEIEVDIDFCPHCGGIWLDGGEVDSVMRIGARTLAAESRKARAPKAPISEKPQTAPELIGAYLSLFPKPDERP